MRHDAGSAVSRTKGSAVYPNVERAVTQLGHDISLARRARRIGAEEFATRMGVSRATLHRLETGDPGVSLNTLAMALSVLGRLDVLAKLVDQPDDAVGLMLMRQKVPKRIAKPRAQRATQRTGEEEAAPVPTDNGFVGW